MTELRRGPLAWGQHILWLFDRTATISGKDLLVSFSEVPVPEPIDVARLLDAIDTLVARHEALRTTFVTDRLGTPWQVVHEFDHRHYEYRMVTEPADDWLGRPFDLSVNWPVRVEMIGTGERVTRLRLGIHILLMDHHGHEALLADLRELVEAGYQRRQPDLPTTIWHPLDITALESTAFGVRESERALEYWEKELARVPNSPFPGAREQRSGDGRFSVRLVSRRCRQAVAELAKALRVTEPTVLTAVSALAFVVATGRPDYLVTFVAPNRTRRGMRESLCAMSDRALLSGVVEPGTSFRALIPQIEAAALRGYKHSHYQPGQMRLITAETAVRRGIFLHRLARLNILPGSATASADGEDRPETFETATSPAPFDGVHLIMEIAGGELQVTLRAGDHILPAADGESFLHAWQRLLLAAHDQPDADLFDRTAISVDGLVDHCRIDVGAVADVLGGLEGVDHAAVFLVGKPARLHAFVVTSQPWPTPTTLRAAMVPLLGSRAGLMCPHEFTVCRRAADEPAGYAEWSHVESVHTGPGLPGEPSPPGTDTERCLAAAFAGIHDSQPVLADIGLSYLASGGLLERIPAFLDQVRELGYQGVTTDDVLSWHSIETLARKLEPTTAGRDSQ